MFNKATGNGTVVSKPTFEWVCIAVVTIISALIFAQLTTLAVLLCGWIAMTFALMLFWSLIQSARRARGSSSLAKDVVENHVDSVNTMTALILIGVLGIEISVRKAGGTVWSQLLIGHILLIAGMFLSFVLTRFWYTGLKRKSVHKHLAYAFGIFFHGVYITGSVLTLSKLSRELG